MARDYTQTPLTQDERVISQMIFASKHPGGIWLQVMDERRNLLGSAQVPVAVNGLSEMVSLREVRVDPDYEGVCVIRLQLGKEPGDCVALGERWLHRGQAVTLLEGTVLAKLG